MEKDDFFVIAYKILNYLYSCLKQGKEPNPQYYSHDCKQFSIHKRYWIDIMSELEENGYIRGFKTTRCFSGTVIIENCEPKITAKGIAFLQDNTAIKKAISYLKDIKDIVPFI